MFKKGKKTIETEVDHCIEALGKLEPHDPKYKDIVLNLKDLCEAQGVKPSLLVRITPVLGIVGTFGQMLLILDYEQLRVISSKAFGLLRAKF